MITSRGRRKPEPPQVDWDAVRADALAVERSEALRRRWVRLRCGRCGRKLDELRPNLLPRYGKDVDGDDGFNLEIASTHPFDGARQPPKQRPPIDTRGDPFNREHLDYVCRDCGAVHQITRGRAQLTALAAVVSGRADVRVGEGRWRDANPDVFPVGLPGRYRRAAPQRDTL